MNWKQARKLFHAISFANRYLTGAAKAIHHVNLKIQASDASAEMKASSAAFATATDAFAAELLQYFLGMD